MIESAGQVLRGRVRVSALRDYGIAISFLALFVALSVASPAFLTERNLLNILDQSAVVGIIACGGTLVLIAGGLDLSTGAIFAFSGVVAAEAVPTVGPGPALLLGVLLGVGLGLMNGLLATVGRINAIIVTLSTGIIIRGFAIATTEGSLVRVEDPGYTALGRGTFLSVKYSVWILVGFIAITWFILRFTDLGRYIYASGGNPEAARLSGVRVGLVRTLTFVISGLAAGVAGIIISSRVATGQADTGVGLEITAIAAIVIGGTSILGGEGAIWRTVLGVLLLALIGNGFNLLNVDPTYQRIVQGGIILGAVGIDAWSRRSST